MSTISTLADAVADASAGDTILLTIARRLRELNVYC